MKFYEVVFITRQDVSITDLDTITAKVLELASSLNGKLVKKEYWGLKNLAYQIKGNTKGHYMFLGIEAVPSSIKELDRKIKLLPTIIRHSIIKVDKIDEHPSAIISSLNQDDATINVTN